jgi:hypothetical protein
MQEYIGVDANQTNLREFLETEPVIANFNN